MELKRISEEAIPRAVELAERYRLLNEPEQAASICHDVLATDPENADALKSLLLATTEQFQARHGAKFEDAAAVAQKMATEYERVYYTGVARERWARAKLQQGAHHSMVGDWLRHAMEDYERAEEFSGPGNEDAILRWNACARLLAKVPGLNVDGEQEPLYGD
jgi:hypothetical protein